jgi:hypothetical protein
MSQAVTHSAISFIKYKGETEGEVYAAILIHFLTKNELRDADKCDIELPSNTSKREMNEQYCLNRG